MTLSLPAIVGLKSAHNDKFLRYVTGDPRTHGLLQFSGVQVIDPFAHFDVVTATSGGGLVHIKSRYANKYWVRWSPDSNWITASADIPNEDRTNWACTLFKLFVFSSDGLTVKARFKHVQLGNFACLSQDAAPFDACLFAGSRNLDPNQLDLFNVIDWSSGYNLPTRVALKGDNGKYLGAYPIDGKQYLKFLYDDPNDSKVAQEVFTFSDGVIYIKSTFYGKYWRLGEGDYIVADIDVVQPTGKAVAMFRANVVDIDVVALLNMSKTWYCKRYSSVPDEAPMGNLLCANAPTADQYAVLQVVNIDDGPT